MEHDIYICYDNLDSEVAEKIHQQLRKADISCWMGISDTKEGDSYIKTAKKAIENSRIMVLIVSDVSKDSEVLIRESDIAVRNHLRIITLKVGSSSNQASTTLASALPLIGSYALLMFIGNSEWLYEQQHGELTAIIAEWLHEEKDKKEEAKKEDILLANRKDPEIASEFKIRGKVKNPIIYIITAVLMFSTSLSPLIFTGINDESIKNSIAFPIVLFCFIFLIFLQKKSAILLTDIGITSTNMYFLPKSPVEWENVRVIKIVTYYFPKMKSKRRTIIPLSQTSIITLSKEHELFHTTLENLNNQTIETLIEKMHHFSKKICIEGFEVGDESRKSWTWS